MDLKYGIEANWVLLTTCNFRCDYCFSAAYEEKLSAPIKVYGTPQEWAEGFDRLGETMLLHITGGEPTLYPEFIELCKEVTKKHFLSINSNLTGNCVNRFAELDPSRVQYINAALHFEERERHKGLEHFAERAAAIRDIGHKILISVLMTPNTIKAWPSIMDRLSKFGLHGIPKAMRGPYEGVYYPEAYTGHERSLIAHYTEDAQTFYAPVVEQIEGGATIDMFGNGNFTTTIPSYRGKLCGMGHNLLRIKHDGAIMDCAWNDLGNILTEAKLNTAPCVCADEFCPYYCEKYTNPENLRLEVK